MFTIAMVWNKPHQLWLFQFNVKYSLLILRLFGVWPSIIDKKTRIIKTTWYLKLYPIIFLTCICQLMIHNSPTFHSTEFEWKSDAANLLVSFYGIWLANCLFSSYTVQYYNNKDLEMVIIYGQLLYAKLTPYFDINDIKFSNLLIFYTFKSIVMATFLSYTILEKMYMLSASIQRSLSVFAIHFAILIVPNLFLASMLTVYFLFKQINRKVERIVRLAIVLSSEAQGKRHFRMRRYCELSDRLDEMAVLHMEICRFMQAINKIATLQLTNYITLKFTSILVQLFFVYMYLSVWNQQDGARVFPSRLIINDVESILLNAFELAAIAQVSYMVSREVNIKT